MSFTVRNNSKPIRMSLACESLPGQGENTARLNGKSLKLTTGTGRYLVIDRVWRMVIVEVWLLMSLYAAVMPDPSIRLLRLTAGAGWSAGNGRHYK